jgi:fructokinase
MALFGGIEAGGTKFVCGIGDSPDTLEAASFPTGEPAESLQQAITFFRDTAGRRLAALGIASFGPIDLECTSPTYGYITTTPKTAWRHVDIVGTLTRALGVPVAFETDVNAAAIAEAKWGAARDVHDCVYITVGTGIGGGVLVNRRPVHGILHPEIGHLHLPQLREDPFSGSCAFHGNCLEGLASGPALSARWGCSPERLPADHPAWELEAHYVAVALVNLICTLSPQRIVLGGGVMQQPVLLPLIRRKVVSLLSGYIAKPELNEAIESYIVPPQLGGYSGVLGAILLASALTEPH